ncbi:uncharacterized protein LOC127286139 [Leptopilina boulardi]|uniref:uncharacterized protein LOC127286139 n=1 Tax=Leptopilina boulardi TaxID=63433 RepID=UPI0021F65150|nr:uncharacterized protein LOC127286139 [Leptopilina boulardi]
MDCCLNIISKVPIPMWWNPRDNVESVMSSNDFEIKHSLNNESEIKRLCATNKNVKKALTLQYSEMNQSLNKENDKKRLLAIKEKERKQKARREVTNEKKISGQEKDRLRKRMQNNLACKRAKLFMESEDEKKKRNENNLACKRAKLFMESEDEMKKRNENNLACKKAKLSIESEDEKKKRNEKNLACQKVQLSMESEDEKKKRKEKNLAYSSVEGKNYKENIRRYNNSFAFASMGAKLEIPKGYGPYVFRVHGQVYHNTYALHPDDNENRKYGQLYILDTNDAVLERLKNKCNEKCLSSIMEEIDKLLREINPYAKAFKMMREVEIVEESLAKSKNKPIRNIEMWIKRDRSLNQSKFNIPSCSEVAVVFVSEDGEPPMERDICIHPKDSKSVPISSLSENVDPMTYPVIGSFNPCLKLGKLTQQYVVDVWSKVEGERLKNIRLQQRKLQAELYCGLMDYIHNKAKDENVQPGKIIILPSTFIGGPRCYQQCFMDAMRLVQEFGKPDLFITMTCNPKWREITENLLDVETASDRPDLVARIFQQKVKELMKEIKDKEIFGPIIAFVYVIEFQKRGLPHVHIIIFLRTPIRDAETLDKMICAEIPDETKNPELFNIVKQFQVHGPCGKQNMSSPCMDPEKKVCTKQYPKPLCSETTYGHICVIPCGSTDGMKYLFKYMHKGHDSAIIGYKDDNQEMEYDEIEHYLNTRYVCPPEAMHRLCEFNMHEQSHKTYRLAVHLPNQQSICFKEGLEEEAVHKFKNTTLTAWLKLNEENPEARKYLYTEIPHKYVFVESSKTWKIRERITKPIICRMYFVSPKDIERYFFKILLLYVRGAKSFDDVRTYEGITYNTFTEAARARNLMVDDSEWDNCLTEAVSIKFPKELCRLFAYICVFELPMNALDLWNKYKEHMIFYNNVPEEVALQQALILINEVLNFHGFALNQFGLPNIVQKILEDYTFVDKEANALALKLLKKEAEILIESLNNEQRKIFDDVMAAVHNDNCKNRYFFLSAPGGCGKSYLENTIITALESEELVVVAVAWTGLAANLLRGGRTSHLMFKFPIPINENSTCNISGMSKHAELLRSAKIIIWDEITMAPKFALQAMESMLRDITQCNKPFGGKVILLSGDFRQTLPIVPHGSRTHIVEVCVKNNRLWDLFESRSLYVNVRLQNNDVEFSNWLLNVGDGKPQCMIERENSVLEIPQDLISNGNLNDEIYGSSINKHNESVHSACILSLTNSEVLDLNERILLKLEGQEIIYYSVDSHVDDDRKDINNIVPIEFLNSLTPDGLPPHKLSFKVGCIIMLLRNMNLVQGLCNGTRLVVKSLLRNVISAEIITGKSKGEIVFIPRIDLSPSPDTYPFKMIRRQFPVRLAYAMTINKSQGQSFDKVGIYLPISAFGHGQIYVGCSRVKSKEHLKILALHSAVYRSVEFPEKSFVKNIVYHEIL